MNGSALSTPTFLAVNANIANDGTADSPRGFGNVTTTGSFSVAKEGPSLYRVVVSSPAAPITATLPTDVKAGYRVRFEVELTSSTETNCFFTSPSIVDAQINGAGFVELMAKIDNPSVAGDWKVVDVEEKVTLSLTSTGANTNTATVICVRRNSVVTVHADQAPMTPAGGVVITLSGLPARCTPSASRSAASRIRNLNNLKTGTYIILTSSTISGYVYDTSVFATSCAIQGANFSYLL